MKVIKPLKLGLMHRTFENRQKHYLSVAIYAFFAFDRPQRLLPEMNMWAAAGEALAEGDLLDEGLPKPEPEVTIHGNAYPLVRSGSIGCQARFTMGDLDKSLLVVGDRHWHHGAATKPAPFSSMPVDWAHAFGGGDRPANPGGKGVDPAAGPDGSVIYPLPNIENPKKPIRTQNDDREPAGWSCLPVTAPSRAAFAGTYDKRWQETQMPGFPEDFDAHYFQTAPKDQWLKTLTGREHFVFENMHPDRGRIEGQLPLLLPRCFLTRVGTKPLDVPPCDGEPDPDARPVRPLEELPMRAETLRLFPNCARGVVIYRGVVQVAEDDAADICELMIAADDVRAKRPLSHFQTVLAQRLDKDDGAIHALRDKDLVPASAYEGEALEDESYSDVGEKLASEGLMAANMRRKAELQIEALRAELEAQGVDLEAHPLPDLPPEPEAPSMDDIADQALQQKHEALQLQQEAESKKESAMAEARALLAEQGVDVDAVLAEASGGGPPTFRAKAELATLRERFVLSQNSGVPLPDVERQLADPELFHKLQQAEDAILNAYRRHAQFFPAAGAKADDEAQRLRQVVVEAHAARRSLASVDLTGADLSGLNLHGVDLSGAFLERADLRSANLTGANLTDTVLARADLSEALLHAVTASGANFGDAKLHGTRLTGGVDATRAVFSKADIHRADFSDADISESDMLEASIVETKLKGVQATGVLFINTTLTKVSFAGARLEKCIFLQVDVSGADFRNVHMNEATFVESTGAGARFGGATLKNFRLVHRCRFPRADFSGATLEKANLRDTDLERANFSAAVLEGADLSGCNMRGASLYRAHAPASMWVRTDLRGANMAELSAVMAFFSKARLEGANLDGANLVRADLARAVIDTHTSMSGTDVTQARFIRRPAHP